MGSGPDQMNHTKAKHKTSPKDLSAEISVERFILRRGPLYVPKDRSADRSATSVTEPLLLYNQKERKQKG